MKRTANYLALFLALLTFAFSFVACKTDDNDTATTTQETEPEDSPAVTPQNPPAPEVTYTITFDKNASDATGTMESQTVKKGNTLTLTANGFSRAGYTFSGWNTKSDGKGANYSDKAVFKPTADLNLYAVWLKETATEPNPPPSETPGGTEQKKTITKYLFSAETGSSDIGATMLNWGNGGAATTVDVDGIGKALLLTTGTGWGASAGYVAYQFSGRLSSYETLSFKLYVSDMRVTNPGVDKDIIVKIPEIEIPFSFSECATAVSGKTGWYAVTIPLSRTEWKDVRANENRIAILQRYTGTCKITDIALSKTESETGGGSGGTGDSQPEATGVYRSGMNIIWQDEFDAADPDRTPLSSKWGYDVGRGTSENSDGTNPGNWGWGNGEAQWYSNNDADNTYVSDGTLKIVAKKEAAGDGATWTSGRLVTRNIYENKYGCIEMRAKISEAAGVWPAFWMLRHDIYDAGGTGWPRGGEIDIMESSTRVWGPGKVYGTLHCQAGYGGGPIWSQGMQLSDLEATWHTYAIVWNENGTISWYYDDNLLGTYTAADKNNNDVWPYDENFYIILNLAVGGGLGGEIDPNLSEATMEVDYVRWYQ